MGGSIRCQFLVYGHPSAQASSCDAHFLEWITISDFEWIAFFKTSYIVVQCISKVPAVGFQRPFLTELRSWRFPHAIAADCCWRFPFALSRAITIARARSRSR